MRARHAGDSERHEHAERKADRHLRDDRDHNAHIQIERQGRIEQPREAQVISGDDGSCPKSVSTQMTCAVLDTGNNSAAP